MPSRIIPFVNGQIYHVYNRGSEKKAIFAGRRDCQRLLKAARYYQLEGPKPKLSHFSKSHPFRLDPSKKIVDILAYCFMPNHFHFLIRQIKDGGVSEFISKLTNSYTKYYNTKYDRVGPLFQGEFKAVLIENEEQLLHVSRYIHLNPLSSFLTKDLNKYEWSSYQEYIRQNANNFCNKEIILNFFKTPSDYEQFVLDQADFSQKIEVMKHQLIDRV